MHEGSNPVPNPTRGRLPATTKWPLAPQQNLSGLLLFATWTFVQMTPVA